MGNSGERTEFTVQIGKYPAIPRFCRVFNATRCSRPVECLIANTHPSQAELPDYMKAIGAAKTVHGEPPNRSSATVEMEWRKPTPACARPVVLRVSPLSTVVKQPKVYAFGVISVGVRTRT